MTHPTDAELEAMAVRLDIRDYSSVMTEAAAMLRACKGRARVKQAYLEGFEDGLSESRERAIRPHNTQTPLQAWATSDASNALEPAPDQPSRCAECDCENGGADCNWIAQPAPDHSDWNAAIEAAAETFDRLRGPWMGQNAAAAIRALKKGPPQ